MKKVRFMLMAIAVIAIASGTLAFKAKFDVPLCTDEATINNNGVYTCQFGTFTAVCDEDQIAVVSTEEYTGSPLDVPVCFTTYDTENEECGQDCTSLIVTLDEQ